MSSYKKFAGRVPARKFETVSSEWQWSSKLGKPVKVGERDDYAEIQSFSDCELTKILDKFMPEEVEERYPIVNSRTVKNQKDLFRNFDNYSDGVDPDVANAAQSDLDALQEISGMAEDMREEYGFPETWSYGRIFEEVQKRATSILNKHREVKSDDRVSQPGVGELGNQFGDRDIGSVDDIQRGQNQPETVGKDSTEKGGE